MRRTLVKNSWISLVAVSIFFSFDSCHVNAYMSTALIHSCRTRSLSSGSPSPTSLQSTFFDDIRKFFDGSSSGGSSDNSNDSEEEDIPAGTCRVATIPVESVKPGGLRLFLMFYLLGKQNTPERNSWKANQPTTDEYVVDFWFHDQTAVLTVTLHDKAITIDRTGSNPSTAYMMQETVVVQGILDELQLCAFDESVAEEHRLLILPEPKDAIEKARDSLAFA